MALCIGHVSCYDPWIPPRPASASSASTIEAACLLDKPLPGPGGHLYEAHGEVAGGRRVDQPGLPVSHGPPCVHGPHPLNLIAVEGTEGLPQPFFSLPLSLGIVDAPGIAPAQPMVVTVPSRHASVPCVEVPRVNRVLQRRDYMAKPLKNSGAGMEYLEVHQHWAGEY